MNDIQIRLQFTRSGAGNMCGGDDRDCDNGGDGPLAVDYQQGCGGGVGGGVGGGGKPVRAPLAAFSSASLVSIGKPNSTTSSNMTASVVVNLPTSYPNSDVDYASPATPSSPVVSSSNQQPEVRISFL